MQAIHMYGLTVPPDGIPIKGHAGVNATFRITMAAIDPTEEPVTNGESHPRATLKLIRSKFPPDEDDDLDGYDSDDLAALDRIAMDYDDSDDDSDEEMVNGGPSDPERAKKLLREALLKGKDGEDDDEDEDGVEPKTLQTGVNGIFKGKGKAVEMDEDDDGVQEFVVCTLDSNQHYQQPLDITIQGNEDCFFRVIGGHTIHLTGNYVLDDLPDSDEEDDEDSEDDEEYDTLDNMLLNADSDSEEDESEEDELDGLAHPRIMELDDDEEEAPQLVKVKPTKKRAAEEEAEAAAGSSAKAEDGKANRSKKLKTNAGDAVAAGKNQPKKTEEAEAKDEKETAKPKTKKELKQEKKEQAKKEQSKKTEQSQANGKKVQFADKLEQGPTPPKGAAPGPRNVGGVMVDDKKMGTGPAAKKGDKVGLRYIGKLKDGKVFDANKKGSPFKFKIGVGEVIKGWDIGVQGMSVGGERRIVIPARLGYGAKGMPGIPANSELTFDLKMISIN